MPFCRLTLSSIIKLCSIADFSFNYYSLLRWFAYLVANARKLRESDTDDVRNSVYLNADLTRAQAQAAYKIRHRRRVNGQRGRMFLNSSARRGRADLNDDNQLTAPDSMETQSADAGAAVAVDASSAAAAAGCNTNALTFVPSSVPSSIPSTAVHVARPADVTVPDAVSASGGRGRHRKGWFQCYTVSIHETFIMSAWSTCLKSEHSIS